jgi:outer membrane protein, heavy metal efflux system
MRFFAARLRQASVMVCALSASCVVIAAPSGDGALTLAQAVEYTIARNPDLQASAFALKTAEARISQARLRSNPELAVEIDGLAAEGIAAAPDERQTTLTLGQVLELGAKRDRRIKIAGSERDVVAIEQQAHQLDALAEVARRFIDVVAAQERVSLAREATGLTEQTATAIGMRVVAARTPRAELSRAQIAVTRAHADERQAESVLRGAKRSLVAMWGESTVAFQSARADLLTLESLVSLEALQERLNRNPDLARFASQGRLRDAELRLAQSQARPNLTIRVGLRRFQATGDLGFTAGVSVALPLFDRNQGAIAEARVRRQQTGAEQIATRTRLQAELFALYQQLLSSRDLLNTLQNEALPQARAALEQLQSGYDRGRFSYLELGVAQQDLVSLRAAVIDTATDYHRLAIEIERLTAEPIARESITTGEFP